MSPALLCYATCTNSSYLLSKACLLRLINDTIVRRESDGEEYDLSFKIYS